MSIVQQINEGLQALGFSQSLAAQLDQFIAFLGVLLVAYLADTVCRKILLKVVSRLVKLRNIIIIKMRQKRRISANVADSASENARGSRI